jgi:hypothetical protein
VADRKIDIDALVAAAQKAPPPTDAEGEAIMDDVQKRLFGHEFIDVTEWFPRTGTLQDGTTWTATWGTSSRGDHPGIRVGLRTPRGRCATVSLYVSLFAPLWICTGLDVPREQWPLPNGDLVDSRAWRWLEENLAAHLADTLAQDDADVVVRRVLPSTDSRDVLALLKKVHAQDPATLRALDFSAPFLESTSKRRRREATLAEREAALAKREAALAEREAALARREALLRREEAHIDLATVLKALSGPTFEDLIQQHKDVGRG